MRYMVSSGIRGNSQCNNGAMMREECLKEFASFDAEKISAIQSNAGSQYLRNARNLSTANQNRIQRAGQSEYEVLRHFLWVHRWGQASMTND